MIQLVVILRQLPDGVLLSSAPDAQSGECLVDFVGHTHAVRCMIQLLYKLRRTGQN
jgi:hypothetical protein